MKNCCVEHCKNEARAKTYCRTHYQHLIRYGKIMVFNCKETIRPPLNRRDKVCCVPDCENKCHARGMCSMHYMRERKDGLPPRQYTPKKESMMREERRYLLSNDEVECIGGLFKECVGMNEGENVMSFE